LGVGNCNASDSKDACIAGKFVQSLVRRRAFRSAWFIDGWPHRFFGFLGGDELKEETGRLLKDAYEAYELAKTKDTQFYNDLCSKRLWKIEAMHVRTMPSKIRRSPIMENTCLLLLNSVS
jgi:hypothetical protein